MGDEDKKIFLSINSTGWLFATVVFLMLIFVMAIVNAIFFIRIYNQSKDRDTGTGITGLSVTGSLVIGIVSIIISLISFAWSLYLITKIYKYRADINEWYTTKKTKLADWKKQQAEKIRSFKTAFNFFKRSGESDEVAKIRAEQFCNPNGYVKAEAIPTAPPRELYGVEAETNPFM